jgi:hypothetical protein
MAEHSGRAAARAAARAYRERVAAALQEAHAAAEEVASGFLERKRREGAEIKAGTATGVYRYRTREKLRDAFEEGEFHVLMDHSSKRLLNALKSLGEAMQSFHGMYVVSAFTKWFGDHRMEANELAAEAAMAILQKHFDEEAHFQVAFYKF